MFNFNYNNIMYYSLSSPIFYIDIFFFFFHTLYIYIYMYHNEYINTAVHINTFLDWSILISRANFP